ncbi:MAG: FAD-dependent monooxygenase, partial [Myxococcales bacterium]|nr:FAD-dependent monooxygenase [Myxococcales bacterium]
MLANVLADAGKRVTLVERRENRRWSDSRCTSVQARVVEIFDALGLLDVLDPELHRVDGLVFYDRHAGQNQVLLDITAERVRLDCAHPHAMSVPQWRTEEALTERLTAKPTATLLRGWSFGSLT